MNNSYVVADEINSLVNRSTTYMTDWQQYGLPEYWEIARPGGFEDCDGYALAKRGRLLAAGWPIDKQMLCVCITEAGDRHLVEAVETDKGWFIMDNRFAGLMHPRFNAKPYGTFCTGNTYPCQDYTFADIRLRRVYRF